ncbi:hypothetical protein JMJ77_0010646 [Colletotrichum scovillei]|uniref:Uncharacterized protein n=1 Tax=Colletotrichum scovillei TaxID=1209932 RepID=A0A9P7R2H3_9PEZI|nr:hypothetical protein JMJ77_0010646 [Colletotrichum scovillei]KAG7059613.1 hypothetical protein JMJ78_0014903 [Colletotrichum scovillei]KAG7067058.1 hypothetical protein JMJ76_0008502 [Colletotrichum scovillei]
MPLAGHRLLPTRALDWNFGNMSVESCVLKRGTL